jgi:hypothetical protein
MSTDFIQLADETVGKDITRRSHYAILAAVIVLFAFPATHARADILVCKGDVDIDGLARAGRRQYEISTIYKKRPVGRSPAGLGDGW